MPGRYVDELRRITREQGGAPPSQVSDPAPQAPANARRLRAVGVLAAVLLLAGGGWLLVRQMIADSRLQDCVMSGRKNCAPAEVDPPGR